MKTIVVASLIALAFTTGFTCSKNQPAENATTETAPAAPTQEQMAAPAEGGAPAEGTAAPTEGAPAAPATTEETK